MEILEIYQQAEKEVNEARARCRYVLNKAFQDCCKLVFEQNPNLQSFSWTCYTPYFNDGDECKYRVCSDYPAINRSDEKASKKRELPSLETLLQSVRDGKQTIEEALAVVQQPFHELAENSKKELTKQELEVLEGRVSNFLQIFDDQDYLEMFGDHCKVTVTRNKIEIDPYDHE
jgi:hypothetical protein